MSSYPQFPVPPGGVPHPGNMQPVYAPVEPPPAAPLPYHRLARTYPVYRWWKPVMVGLIALGLYLGMMFMAMLVFVFTTMADPGMGGTLDESMVSMETIEIDMRDPMTFAFTMVSLILMIPALLLATRMMNFQKVGMLTSVRGTMRWGWLGTCMAVAAGLLLLSFGISTVLDLVLGVPFEAGLAPGPVGPDTWTLLLLTVLLVPFQATAEEYVFRGYLMQLIGGWLKHPAFAILLPIPLFVVGHEYDIYGQLDVALFALAAGWLAWRTGGLEASIALHVINNSVIFALGAFGLVDVNATEGNLASLLFSAATMGLFVFVVVKLADRRKIDRLSTGILPAPQAR
ncbi:CPBP family intramembrane glutamic endopeptidase [Paeniglutamicibacter sp. R2-26]|uniref:CPBP family intramembrane glutamic endopeptidase n=1 Tax=Paeniglutamicibacter sp. R2-26 TaxID=3144417 RepID=UPI003EE4F643